MANTLRIKRRAAGGAAGAPASLANAELAFNEQDNTLYYGSGTGANDINEAEALRQAFGDTLGAAGALELVVTVDTLRAQDATAHQLPRTGPALPAATAFGWALPHAFEAALSNSFAFGGINAALVVSRSV